MTIEVSLPTVLRLRRALLLGLLAIPSSAHAAFQEWGAQSGTTWSDNVEDVAWDPAAGAFVAGWRFQTGPVHQRQAFLELVLPGGQVAWSRDLGAPDQDDHGYGVALDGAGGALLAGSTAGDLGSGSHGGMDAFVASFDGQGQVQWLRQYGSSLYEEAKAICSDGAGGYFLTGLAFGGFGGVPAGTLGTWVMRIDGAGNPLWSVPVTAPSGTTEPSAIASDGAGGLYVCGWTTGSLGGPQLGIRDAWLSRVDGTGSLLWARQFGGAHLDIAHGVAAAPSHGAFVGGSFDDANPSESPVGFLQRYSSSGQLEWSVETGAPEGNEVLDVASNGSGGVFAAGYGIPPTVSSFDAWYASYSGIGVQEYLHHVGNPVENESEVGTAVAADGVGGLLLAGRTDGSLYGASAGLGDLFVARFDACELDPWSVTCSSNPNSTGAVAQIGAFGSARVSNDSFALATSSCPSGMLGLFILSTSTGSMPFGDGVLCLGGGVLRLLPAVGTGNSGSAVVPLDFDDPSSSASQITPGSTWNFQFWYRDTASLGAGFNLSNALSATFCP
jgi:hypothetical protein